jgi:hypothetical protein
MKAIMFALAVGGILGAAHARDLGQWNKRTVGLPRITGVLRSIGNTRVIPQ